MVLHSQADDGKPRSIALDGGELLLWQRAWVARDADRLLQRLRVEVPWEQHRLRFFGREVPAPRLSAWYGDPGARYAYSGLRLEPRPWSATLAQIRTRVETLAGQRFNSVLANLYRDGRDSMGWHSDDEPELGSAPVIASVSLGSERLFRLQQKSKSRERRVVELSLPHGSLLVMRGVQRHWRHSLPKTREPCAERINLTFREILGADP